MSWSGEASQPGKQFEHNIAALYEHLGYRVTHDILVGEKQVDLVVEKVLAGFGLARFVIECKQRGKSPIGADIVRLFAATVTSLRQAEPFVAGILVTNSYFTRDAKSVASGLSYINLVTEQELTEEIFHVRESYEQYVQGYRQRDIYHSYIPLQCDMDSLSVSDIEGYVIQDLKGGRRGVTHIVGDFGTGKTTLMERLKYVLAGDFLSRKSKLKPVLFLLKDFYKVGSAEGLVRLTLNKEFRQDIPLEAFWNMAKQGSLVLLLDGFDEMSSNSDKSSRFENMVAISRLLSTESRAILTCRPSHFLSDEEFSRYVEATNRRKKTMPIEIRPSASASRTRQRRASKFAEDQQQRSESLQDHLALVFLGEAKAETTLESSSRVLNLSALNRDQLKRFLMKKESAFREAWSCSWVEVLDFLDSVYDLSDLVRRPILLSMIVETITSRHVNPREKEISIGPARLYQIYTNMQFAREHQKGMTRQLLSKKQRLQFAEAIALRMFDENKLEVTYKEIVATVELHVNTMRQLKEVLVSVDPNAVASDIQITTLLRRNDDYLFRFSHKSFMEYLVAFHIKQILERDASSRRLEKKLPKEVIYFVGSFASSEPAVYDRLRQWLEKKRVSPENQTVFRRNIACALLSIAGDVNLLRIRNCQVDGIDIARSNHIRGHLAGSGLRFVKADQISTYDCSWDKVTIESSTLERWQDQFSSFELNLIHSHVKNAEWHKTNAQFVGRKSSFESCTFVTTRTAAHGDFLFKDVVFQEGVHLSGNRIVLENCRFEDGEVVVKGKLLLRRCQFSDASVSISSASLEECSFAGCRIQLVSSARLNGCKIRESVAMRIGESLVENSEIGATELIFEDDASVNGCTILSGSRLIGSPLVFERCALGKGKYIVEGDVDLGQSTLNESEIDVVLGSVSRGYFQDSAIELSDSASADDCVLSGQVVVGGGEGSVMKGARLKSGKVTFNGRFDVNNCSFSDEYEVIAQEAQFADCRFSDGRLAIGQDVRISKGIFKSGTFVEGNKGTLEGCTFLEGNHSFEGELELKAGIFDRSSIASFRSIVLDKVEFRGCECAIDLESLLRDCTFTSETKVRIRHSRIEGCSFNRVVPNVDSSVAIEKCSLSSLSRLHGGGEAYRNCTLNKGTIQLPDDVSFWHCTFGSKMVVKNGQAKLDGCRFNQCETTFSRSGNVKDCEFVGSSVTLIDSELSGCTFRKARVDMKGQSSVLSGIIEESEEFDLSGGKVIDSQIEGGKVVILGATSLLQSRLSRLEICVNSTEGESANVKGCVFEESSISFKYDGVYRNSPVEGNVFDDCSIWGCVLNNRVFQSGILDANRGVALLVDTPSSSSYSADSKRGAMIGIPLGAVATKKGREELKRFLNELDDEEGKRRVLFSKGSAIEILLPLLLPVEDT